MWILRGTGICELVVAAVIELLFPVVLIPALVLVFGTVVVVVLRIDCVAKLDRTGITGDCWLSFSSSATRGLEVLIRGVAGGE